MDLMLAFLLGLVTLAVIALPLILGLRRRLAAAERARRNLAVEAEFSREVLTAAPDGLYLWNHLSGGETCSRRLAVLLNLPKGKESRFEDIAACFTGETARDLDQAVRVLRGEGLSFDLTIKVAEGHRRVHALGVRASSSDGRPLADLLWVRDVSEGNVDELPGEALERLNAAYDGFQALLEALPIPIWLRDADLELAFLNQACGGRDVFEAEKDLAARAKLKDRALSERRTVTRDGVETVMEVTETPIRGWVGTAGFAVESTDGVGAGIDEAARDQVLENLATAVAIFGSDKRLSFFNTAYVDLWRLESEWLQSRPTYADILDRLRENRRLPEFSDFKIFRDQEVAQFETLEAAAETQLHLPDGATVRAVVSPHPRGGLVCAYEDVTGHLNLERQFKSLDAVQRETLDNLYEGVAVFGSDGRLKLNNPAFASLWNLDQEFLAREPHVSDFVERMRQFISDVEDWPAQAERLVAGLMSRESETGRLVRSDGSCLEYANVPLPDGAVLLSYLDVTDSARVQQALHERAEALRAADRLKSEFIANVSFEVRTPLNTVIGFAEILKDEYFGQLNPRQLEYTQGILETSRGMMRVVSNILDLATIEAGMMRLQLDAVDLHGTLSGLLTLIRERARRKKLGVVFECPTDIGWIIADEKRLRQVVFNLLGNALKFTPARGEIRLEARRENDEVVLTVADTGAGIPQADQDRMFQAFETGSSEAGEGGTGLGLSLVKRFVELHGGRIDLKSVPNRGTTVTCYLPASSPET
jgi:signal transduction histidine kinase